MTETDAPTIRVVCMDCGVEFKRVPCVPSQAGEMSHGLCDVHLEQRQQELEFLKNELQKQTSP